MTDKMTVVRNTPSAFLVKTGTMWQVINKTTNAAMSDSFADGYMAWHDARNKLGI